MAPPKSSWPSTESPVTNNTVTTQQRVLFETAIVQKEDLIAGCFFLGNVHLDDLDQYACGYLGYVAPNACVESTNLVIPSVHEHPIIVSLGY